jgi:hypothetical protein
MELIVSIVSANQGINIKLTNNPVDRVTSYYLATKGVYLPPNPSTIND